MDSVGKMLLLNGLAMYIILWVFCFISLILVFTYYQSYKNKKAQLIISGISFVVCFSLLISLVVVKLKPDNGLTTNKVLETNSYKIKEITKDYIIYGEPSNKLSLLNMSDKEFHKTESEETPSLVIEKRLTQKNWLFWKIGITGSKNIYHIYVDEDIYDILYSDYVLYKERE